MFQRRPKNKQQFVWYFTAYFEDGHVIEQNDDTELGTSTMITVNHYAKESPLVAFELSHVNGKNKVTVDLITGAFIVNGVPIEANNDFSFEPKIDPKTKKQIKFSAKGKNLELQYWREKTEVLNATATMQEDRSVTYGDYTSSSNIGRYFIGWKSGKNQAILAVG
jgi:hypothetical protein